eukprot:6193978-Pleurochrysis_carterae.AAC.1
MNAARTACGRRVDSLRCQELLDPNNGEGLTTGAKNVQAKTACATRRSHALTLASRAAATRQRQTVAPRPPRARCSERGGSRAGSAARARLRAAQQRGLCAWEQRARRSVSGAWSRSGG